MELQQDDLSVGLFVSVCRGPTCYRHGRDGTVIESYEDESFMGDVLSVTAINLPFVVIRRVDDGMTIPLDLRRYGLTRLSEEYVAAMGQARASGFGGEA